MITLLRNFINGLAFGITQIVPGVSGGTIAVIMGFYDEMLDSVNNFTQDWRKSVRFLLPVLVGTVAGILLFSSLINYFLESFSLPTMAFFIGLIIGIIPAIFGKIRESGVKLTAKDIALIAVPVAVLAVISHLKTVDVSNPEEIVSQADFPFMVFVFFSGMVAAAALVVPGVSGSFVLLLVGVYPIVTYSLSSVGFWLADVGNFALLLDIVKILAPLGIGIVIGGLSMARLIGKLLKDYTRVVYSLILGLLIGSVYALIREPLVFQSGTSAPAVIIAVVTFVIGCMISFYLGKKRL